MEVESSLKGITRGAVIVKYRIEIYRAKKGKSGKDGKGEWAVLGGKKNPLQWDTRLDAEEQVNILTLALHGSTVRIKEVPD